MMRRARGNRFLAAVDYLVGYDVFISYSRRDSAAYARALKDQLNDADLSCFLDCEEVASGSELRPSLGRALRRSSALAVVVSGCAKSSPYVALEIEEFARKKRPIMPILPAGEGLEVPWSAVRERNLVWIEEGPGALATGEPSAETVAAVKTSLQVMRRRALATRLMLSTAFVILLLSVGVFFVAMQYFTAAAKENLATVEAKRQQQIAEKNTQQALAEQRRAEIATRNAEQRKVAATVESLARQAVIGNQDDRLSLLFAVEAVNRASVARLPTLVTAEHALRQAVARAGGVPLLPGPREGYEVQGSFATDDGRWLALGVRDGQRRFVALYSLTEPSRGPTRRLVSPQVDGIDVQSLAVSRDGRFVVAGSHSSQQVLVWTIDSSDAKVRSIDAGGGVYRPQITADTRWLCLDRSLFALRAGAEKPIVEVEPNLELTLSPDGQWIAETSGDVVLQRVSYSGREEPIALRLTHVDEKPLPAGEEMPAHEKPYARIVQSTYANIEFSAIDFSPDSRWMLAISESVAFLWDMRHPSFPQPDFSGNRPHAFSHNSRYLVIDGRLYYLGASSPRSVPLRGNSSRETYPQDARAAGFSPDGRWLAIADTETRVWDLRSVADRQPRFILRGPNDVGTTTVRFSPNGRWLATGGNQSRLWDLSLPDPGVAPITLTTAESFGNVFAFSGDSRWLVSTGSVGGGPLDGERPDMYRAWPLETPDLLRVARRLAGRSFTPAEWLTLFPDEPYSGAQSTPVQSMAVPTAKAQSK